jgi:hypothetical protein
MAEPTEARRRATRLLAVLGVTSGLVLLARPGPVVTALCPQLPKSRLWVVRVLGARLVAQHAVVLAAPEASVVRAASAVDVLHAVSMVPLIRSPRYGRAARISGGIAAALAAIAPAVAPRSERR